MVKNNQLVSVFNQKPNLDLASLGAYDALVVTGIANPKPIYRQLEGNGLKLTKLQFADHHNFTESDIAKIVKRFTAIQSKNKVLICTEKDAVRLREFSNHEELKKLPIFYLPIEVEFLNQGEAEFQCSVQKFIKQF